MAGISVPVTGSLTGVAVFKGTDAAWQAGLGDYLILHGLDTTGTNKEKMDRIAQHMLERNIVEIKNYRRDKLISEQRAALEAQLNSELPL